MGKTRRHENSDTRTTRHQTLSRQISPYASALFKSNHLMFTDAPSKSHVDPSKRGVLVSSAIYADQDAIIQLKKIVVGWRKGTSPVTGTIYTSPTAFNVKEWVNGEPQERRKAYLLYSMVRDSSTGKWIMHHLDGLQDTHSEGRKSWQHDDSSDDESDTSASDSEACFESETDD